MYIGDLASIPVYLKSSPWLDKNINSRDGETVSIPKPVQPQQIPAIPPQTLTPPQNPVWNWIAHIFYRFFKLKSKRIAHIKRELEAIENIIRSLN